MDKFEIKKKEVTTSELVVKKSKFIAKVYYVDNTNKINEILETNKKEFKDARHIVYAYRLSNTGKFSDDKEPQGTAGKPIYNILEKENLVNVLVIVIRYFGGILLGAGPLTRAYSTVANDAIKLSGKKEYIEYQKKEIVCEYKEEENIKNKLKKQHCVIKEIIHTDKVTIKFCEPKGCRK